MRGGIPSVLPVLRWEVAIQPQLSPQYYCNNAQSTAALCPTNHVTPSLPTRQSAIQGLGTRPNRCQLLLELNCGRFSSSLIETSLQTSRFLTKSPSTKVSVIHDNDYYGSQIKSSRSSASSSSGSRIGCYWLSVGALTPFFLLQRFVQALRYPLSGRVALCEVAPDRLADSGTVEQRTEKIFVPAPSPASSPDELADDFLLPDIPTFNSVTVFPETTDESRELAQAFFSSRLYQPALKWILTSAKMAQLICLSIPFGVILATFSIAYTIRTSLDIVLRSLSRFSTKPTGPSFLTMKFLPTFYELENFVVDLCWEYFYWAVSVAGPSYIKFVQWASTRADLFPPSFCVRFARFHRQVRPHPYPYTVKVLRDVFGPHWESQVWIDPQAVGAGCIAQVYRGVMVVDSEKNDVRDLTTDKGECNTAGEMRFQEVAMKVVHPYTARAMEVDFDVMQVLGSLIEFIPRAEYVATKESAKQFRAQMVLQLDMTVEAENLERFHDNLSRSWSRKHLRRLGTRIVVPQVLKHYTNKHLLVESYEEGLTLGQWMNVTKKLEEETAFSKTEKIPDDDAGKWNSKGFFLKYIEDNLQEDDQRQHDMLNPLAPRSSLWKHYQSRVPHLFETGRKLARDQVDNMKGAIYDLVVRVCRLSGASHEGLLPDPTTSPDYGTKTYWSNVARSGLAFFLQMIFVDNFVHADLHPGNLIIRFRKIDKNETRGKWERRWDSLKRWMRAVSGKDETRETFSNKDSALLTADQLEQRLKYRYSRTEEQPQYSPMGGGKQQQQNSGIWSLLSSVFVGNFDDVDFELVLLDCGLTTSLAFREYCNFADLLRCICTGDGYTGGKLMVERARKESCKDVNSFCQEVDDIVRMYHGSRNGSSKLGDARVGEIGSRMLRAACYHRVELDPRLASLIAAIVVLEGVGRQLDPSTDLVRAALPYVQRVLMDATIWRQQY